MMLTQKEIDFLKAIVTVIEYCDEACKEPNRCMLCDLNIGCVHVGEFDNVPRIKAIVAEIERKAESEPVQRAEMFKTDLCEGNTDCTRCTKQLCPYR